MVEVIYVFHNFDFEDEGQFNSSVYIFRNRQIPKFPKDSNCVMDTRDSDLGDDSMVSWINERARSDGKNLFQICEKIELKFSRNFECGSDMIEARLSRQLFWRVQPWFVSFSAVDACLGLLWFKHIQHWCLSKLKFEENNLSVNTKTKTKQKSQ